MKETIRSRRFTRGIGLNLTNKALRLVFGFIILFCAAFSVHGQGAADGPPNGIYSMSHGSKPVTSVPESQIDGAAATNYEWNTIYTNRFAVSGLVSDSDMTDGHCTLYDDGTFNCYADEHGIDRNYTGTYGQAGYRVQFTFNSDGLQEFKDMLTHWVEQLAYEDEADISNISFNFTSVTISRMTISKRTGIPGNVTVTIRGKVSAILDGRSITKSFSYSSKVTFQ